MNHYTKAIPIALLSLPMAGLLMGNSSCQSNPTPPPRELKKIISLGAVSASNINIPGGPTFDFKSVASQQIYVAYADSNDFALSYLPPLNNTSTPVSATTLKLSDNDMKLVKAAAAQRVSSPYSSWSKEASCMVNLPMATIATAINSFEMVGGGGIDIGYNPAGPLTPPLASLNFQISFAQLDLSVIAVQPLTNVVLGAAEIDSKQTKTSINAMINLGQFSIGPSFYYQTPLANVTMHAMNLSASAVKAKLDSEEWYTRVLENDDFTMTIIGGNNVDIQNGDEFAVYNEAYNWTGEPCASTYLGGAAVSPVALLKVIGAGDIVSIAQVVARADENAVVGGKVRLYKLHEQTNTNPGVDVSGLVNVQPPTTTTLVPPPVVH